MMKKSNKKPFYVFNIIAIVCIMAVIIIVNHKAVRGPAGLPKIEMFDLSNLQGSEFKEAVTKQILKEVSIKRKNSLFEFSFGNFIIDKQNGEALYFCQYFDTFSLVFEAEGMATSGDRPQLIVNGTCKLKDDLKTSESVKIPVDLIKKLKPSDVDWNYDQQPGVSYSFRNLSGFWPDYWVLSHIKLINSMDPSKELNLDRYTIYKNTSTPPMMDWGN